MFRRHDDVPSYVQSPGILRCRQGTQSGPAPSAANNSSVTSTPAPVAKDSTMVNEPLPKADRN